VNWTICSEVRGSAISDTAMQVWSRSSRMEPCWCSADQRDLADAVPTQHAHQKSSEPYSGSAVRRASVAEKFQIATQRFQRVTAFHGLLCQSVISMLALRTGRDLQPFPEEIKSLSVRILIG
jgi:hypothetical protein